MSTTAKLGLLRLLRGLGVRRFTAASGLGHRFVCHVGDFAGENPFYNRDSNCAELTLMTAWCHDIDRPVIYDVGANLGFVSTQLAQLLRSRHPQIIAFEPVASTFDKLRYSIRALGLEDQVTPVCCAISDQPGFVSVASDVARSLFAQVRPDAANPRAGSDLSWVATQTLDQVTKSLSLPPTLLKVDVEGFEAHVFRGARRLLQRPDAPAILFELNPLTLAEVGSSSKAVAETLSGYLFYYVNDFQGQLMEFGDRVDDVTTLTQACNLFAVQRGDLSSGRWEKCLESLSTLPQRREILKSVH